MKKLFVLGVLSTFCFGGLQASNPSHREFVPPSPPFGAIDDSQLESLPPPPSFDAIDVFQQKDSQQELLLRLPYEDTGRYYVTMHFGYEGAPEHRIVEIKNADDVDNIDLTVYRDVETKIGEETEGLVDRLRVTELSIRDLDHRRLDELFKKIINYKRIVKLTIGGGNFDDSCLPLLWRLVKANPYLHKIELRGEKLTLLGRLANSYMMRKLYLERKETVFLSPLELDSGDSEYCYPVKKLGKHIGDDSFGDRMQSCMEEIAKKQGTTLQNIQKQLKQFLQKCEVTVEEDDILS